MITSSCRSKIIHYSPGDYLSTINFTSFILLGVSIILLGISLIDYVSKKQTLKYKETECTINKLDRIENNRGSDYIDLEYSYIVNNKKYTNNKFSMGLGDIREYENKYQKQKVFPVYYDENNPQNAVLVKGGRINKIDGTAIIGFILMMISIIGFGSNKNKVLRGFWESMAG